jgi:hypothetical protein
MGEPKQKILPEEPFPLTVIEASEEEVFQIIERFKRTPFDLENGLLANALLAKYGDGKFIFFLILHHIISDGSSLKILFEDLLKSYDAIKKQTSSTLQPLPIQYTDYCRWQHSVMVQDRMKTLEKYWLDKFQGNLPICELLGDKTRPTVFNFKGRRKLFTIPEDLHWQLNQVALKQNATLFMVLLGTVYTLIYRFTGQKDLIVGSPVSGRSHYDLRQISGLFVNTLALRCFIESEDSFFKIIDKVKVDLLEALEHQDYPFDHLIDKLGLLRDTSRSPLFNINVALQNFDLDEESKLELKYLRVDRQELTHHSC